METGGYDTSAGDIVEQQEALDNVCDETVDIVEQVEIMDVFGELGEQGSFWQN